MQAPEMKFAGKSEQETWLNRTVLGLGVTSLLADFSHEMATAVLPGFLATLGAGAAALGLIEAVADGLMSLTKFWAGWLSDRINRRKPFVVGGYFLTGGATGLLALATGWPFVLLARAAAWFGRGARGPVRNSILASSIPAASLGKAFGLERAGDSTGAILGPLVGVALLARLHHLPSLNPAFPFRMVFVAALIPGLGAGISFATLVRETPRQASSLPFRTAVGNLPGPFRRALWGIGVFGMGDFARTLMILAAAQRLSASYGTAHAAQLAALLYVAHNVVYAGFAYPAGALSDRFGRTSMLAAGYLLAAMAAAGLALAFAWRISSIPAFLVIFALAGVAAATGEAVEGALTADFVTAEARGTAYGALGAVNGVGDFFASLVVGILWSIASPVVAFVYAATAMMAGAILTLRLKRR